MHFVIGIETILENMKWQVFGLVLQHNVIFVTKCISHNYFGVGGGGGGGESAR